ncbi:putative 20S proteasome subunit alpha type 2 [Coniochaeta sp. 2T2.1]|nr:putative 20S proteasome subunit alpha type 2 [Coniochaeta sp. 2T2.1]
MEYKRPQHHQPPITPRLIIHGGAGNIKPSTVPPEKWAAYRASLLSIVSKTHSRVTTPNKLTGRPPSALEVATFAVRLLEDDPLFNAGRGAVFTRDGINELEASVMVSRGYAKRGVGVMGLRRVKNPILLARAVLERGDGDLGGYDAGQNKGQEGEGDAALDVPSAQGHTQIHGLAAESLARRYGLEMVEPAYFFTQNRWDEHIRALQREKEGSGLSSWSRDEYLPQGTVGAIALDAEGTVCCATSTGGLTNKLTGRIGDTPVVGAGFWAEKWVEHGELGIRGEGPVLRFEGPLSGLLADCLPSLGLYTPVDREEAQKRRLTTTRSMAVSGTGNGDSFLRVAAARTVGAIARFGGVSTSEALSRVAGPGGELQKSAGSRWGRTGEGEGGIIGIELVVIKDEEGNVVETKSEIVQDFNCGGMLRAWIDEDGCACFKAFREEDEEL